MTVGIPGAKQDIVRLNSRLYHSCRPYYAYAPHQLPRLRISGAISLFLLYAFVVYTGKLYLFTLQVLIIRKNYHFFLSDIF